MIVDCIQTILDHIVSFNHQFSFCRSKAATDFTIRMIENIEALFDMCVAPRESPAYGNMKPKKSPTKKRLYANMGSRLLSLGFTIKTSSLSHGQS